jgi:diaminopimelate decarboxylase
MTAVHYQAGILHVEGLAVTALAARYGTPLYVYSLDVLEGQYRALEANLRGLARNVLICYALKANANPTLGHLLAGWGAGADVVSGGEVYLAARMGFPPDRIVFAGVGKTRREIAEGLAAGVRSFHVESAGELDALAAVAAEQGRVAPVAVRVNPDVDAHTHPYITTGKGANKFGVPPAEAAALLRRAAAHPHLHPHGLHAHVGSQLMHVQPILDAAARLLDLWDALTAEGITLHELDIGGGLGIPYHPDDAPEGPAALAAGLRPLLAGRTLDLVLEPGRFLVGPAGVLLSSVSYVKQVTADDGSPHTLLVMDAGMTDLLRPALYGAYHPVYPIHQADRDTGPLVDLVGPICESSDVLAVARRLGTPAPGDILTIAQAGAYGYAMASHYNARPRPAEVLVIGPESRLIRPRETYAALWPPAEG